MTFWVGEKGRRRDAVFLGLTSWPVCLETAVGSFPGLHRFEKKEGQGLDMKEDEVTQETEFKLE